MLHLLRAYGADMINYKKGKESPLCTAVQYGYEKMVRFVLKNGMDPNSKSLNGASALQLAVQRNATAIADLLIDHGANITDTTYLLRMPPLCMAVEYRHEEMVVLLLNKAADINEKTSSGRSAIHFAVCGKNLSITKLLLQRNIDLTAP